MSGGRVFLFKKVFNAYVQVLHFLLVREGVALVRQEDGERHGLQLEREFRDPDLIRVASFLLAQTCQNGVLFETSSR
jgi:hypothetical protein